MGREQGGGSPHALEAPGTGSLLLFPMPLLRAMLFSIAFGLGPSPASLFHDETSDGGTQRTHTILHLLSISCKRQTARPRLSRKAANDVGLIRLDYRRITDNLARNERAIQAVSIVRQRDGPGGHSNATAMPIKTEIE
jgi:hypothetical protein